MGKSSLKHHDVRVHFQNLIQEEVVIPHKTIIERSEKQSRGIYIIKSGILKYVIPFRQSKITVSFEGPGTVIGLNSIFKLPNSFNVVSITKATLDFIPAQVIQHPINKGLRESDVFISMCYDEIIKLKQKLLTIFSMDANQRIVQFLLELSNINGHNHTGAITKKEISEYAGCSIEYTHRSLAKLQRQDLIQADKRNIIIQDKKTLQKILDKK